MSIELQDLGKVKVSQQAHSFIKAQAEVSGRDVVEVARDLIHEALQNRFDIFRIADAIHKSKGLGEILRDGNTTRQP